MQLRRLPLVAFLTVISAAPLPQSSVLASVGLLLGAVSSDGGTLDGLELAPRV